VLGDARIDDVTSPAPANPRRADGLLPGLLLLLAVAPYVNSLRNGFVYDDLSQILSNPYVHSFRYLKEIFGSTVWSFQGAEGMLPYYRPVMTLGYALCWKLFGPIALGYHLMSILLQAGVVLMVFFAGRRLLRDDLSAFLAAALFALHPIHTESVAWVAGVTDLELTLFYLLAFSFFLRLGDESRRPRWLTQTFMALTFALALLSKEHAVTLPVLAVFYEHCVRADRGETRWTTKLSRYGPLWLLLVAYLAFRASILGVVAPSQSRAGISRAEAALSALSLLAKYFGKLFWPVHLTLFYQFHKSTRLTEPGVSLGLFSLLACLALFLVLWKRNRPLAFALVWFFVTLAPALNVRWMLTNVFAERYLYLPSVGFAWLAGASLAHLWRALAAKPVAWRWSFGSALGVVALLCAARIVTQNPIWLDQDTFIRRTLAASSEAEIARANLGALYWNQGDLAAAEREWLRALQENPRNEIALTDLGRLRVRQGRLEEAAANFHQAVAVRPNYTRAYLDLGDLYTLENRPQDADAEYRTAVKLAPVNPLVRNHYARFLFNAGRFAEAETEFRTSIDIDATREAYDRLADIALQRGDADSARNYFAAATALESFDSYAHFHLGELYAARGDNTQAIHEYEAGLQTDPNNPAALAALAKLKRTIPAR
jgi:tetratricopeptide (TPR) repeat protein